MKKILLFLLIILLLTPVKKVLAEGISLGIKPTILQIDAQSPAEVVAPFTIYNPGEDPQELSIALRPFSSASSNDGQIAPLQEGQMTGADPLILQKMQITDGPEVITSLTIAPKQKKDLMLHIFLPKGEPPSDYYFSLVFVSKSILNDQSSSSSVVGGIAMNVLLSVGPKDKTTGKIAEFSTPFFVNNGPVPFTLLIENTSNHYFVPRGNLLITNMFGQLIGKINLQQANVLAHSRRYITDDSLASSTQIIWPEKVIFGLYKATLTVALSSDGPLFQQSIYFLAFPYQVLLGLLLAMILVAVVVMRVRKRLKK